MASTQADQGDCSVVSMSTPGPGVSEVLVGWVGRNSWTSGIVAGSFRTECFATWETPEMPLNDIEYWMLSRGPEGNLNEVISYIMYEINVIRISKFISTKGPGQFYDCLEFMELLFCFPGWSGCLPSLGSVLSNRARWSWLWLVEMPCWEFSRVDLRNFNVKQRLVKYMWSDAEIRFFELSERK